MGTTHSTSPGDVHQSDSETSVRHHVHGADAPGKGMGASASATVVKSPTVESGNTETSRELLPEHSKKALMCKQ